MKKILLFLLCFPLLIDCHVATQKEIKHDITYTYLKSKFKNPEQKYGVNCWWWWLNGNVTKEAITKDLEAMKSKKFQGAMIFDAGGHNQRGNRDIPPGPTFGSKEWNNLFLFALDEARRLGLEIGFNIQSGWNLGGPCITPQFAAKQLTFNKCLIKGGKQISMEIPQPSTRKDFYKDVALFAIPLSKTVQIENGIDNLDLKLGFHELGGSAPDCRFLLENNSNSNSNNGENGISYKIKKEDILDITSKLGKDGIVQWDAPAGEWDIIRIGYTCTNSSVSTSSGSWQGSVLDYMSKEAFDYYWGSTIEPIFKTVGDHVGTTLKYMETDSWECGGMNWTDNFDKEFAKYRGYDVRGYLPIIAGYVIDDIDSSNSFLADFRKTLADLVANNHYKVFSEYAHKYNMGIQPESAGPHAGPMDGIKNYGFSDIVMSEFWSPSPHRPRDQDRYFLKQASSAAHIYGKKIVGAESFTTIGPHWNDELWSKQKPSFDHEICSGLNRLYFHTFTCSPQEMGIPGQEYFAGTHINPQVTWWNKSEALIDYIRRIQMMVQEGSFVVDILYYYGDHVPNVFPYKEADPAGALPGFDYDVTDENIFNQLQVKDGKILVPGGLYYEVLVLPDHRILSLKVLEKIEYLLTRGAHIIGYKPKKMVSLVGGSDAQKRFKELSDKIWGIEYSERGDKKYGEGEIIWGIKARDYLLSIGIIEDCKINNMKDFSDIDFIHYTIGNTDLYFVSNQTNKRTKINPEFRVSGLQPELLNPLTGEIMEAKAFTQKDKSTIIPLTLEPYQSIFIVFNNSISRAKNGRNNKNMPDYESVQVIDGSWKVFFNDGLGAPDSIVFDKLIDWTTHPHQGIKFYSGTATYKKDFNINFTKDIGIDYFLQLENVKDVGIAKIRINGIDKGIQWTKPFRFNITNELKVGSNKLEVEVVNSWFNRVAGDELSNSPNKYTKTNIVLKNDFRGIKLEKIDLEPSGLIGPVIINRAILD